MSDAAAPAAPAAPSGENSAAAKPDASKSPQEVAGTKPAAGGENAAAEKKADAARKLKLRLKDDGPEEELDEATVRTNYLKGKAASQLLSKADAALQKAALRDKELTEREAKLKDPKHLWRLLEESGHNPRELAERRVAEDLELETLTPEQRELRELKAWKAEQEALKAEAEKTEAQKRAEAEVDTHVEEFSTLVHTTCEALGLPKEIAPLATPHLARLYDYAESNGMKLEPEEALAHVEGQLAATAKHYLQRAKSLDEVLEMIGPEREKAILQRHLDKLRQKRGLAVAPAKQEAPVLPRRENGQFDSRRGRWAQIDQFIQEGK